MTIEHFAGPDEPCGCGRPVQYETPSGYACNKYGRCQDNPCACRQGECESKFGRLCRMSQELSADEWVCHGCGKSISSSGLCDECYDKSSDSFSIVRAMENI